MGSRLPASVRVLVAARVALAEAVALAFLGCGALRHVHGEGGKFVELYPMARKNCAAVVRGPVLGGTVVVRYPQSVEEETALRFLGGLEDYRREVERDYQLLRKGLANHLGDDLFARIRDRRYLRTPDLEKVWYLLPGEQPALIWRGPVGSAYHFLGPGGPPYGPERLRLRSRLPGEVHEITHWLMHDLLTSRRKALPRWYEEGMCDWAAMHFCRYRDQLWDGGREVVARLTWQRPEVRRRLLRWPMGGVRGRLEAWREQSWESDLLYAGSLGLVFALENELGSQGVVDLLRDLLAASPETDRGARDVIERRLAKPLDQAGLLSEEARRAILNTLLDRVRVACDEGTPAPAGLPLSALGHFPEAEERVLPALRSLAFCPKREITLEGLNGLRYLGRREVVEETVRELRRSANPDVRAALDDDNRFKMAEEFAHARMKAARWFDRPGS